MEERYAIKARRNLNNAKSELEEVIYLLKDSIVINDDIFEEDNIKNINKKISSNANRISYNIIPTLRQREILK